MLIGIANSIGSGSIATRGPELITNGKFSELGSELFVDSSFTNGTSDWDVHPTNSWLGNAGGASGVQSLVGPITTDNVIYQEVLTSGKYYKAEWSFVTIQSGVTVHLASSNAADYLGISNADDSAVFLSTDDYLGMRLKYVAGYNVMYLNSFSVKETNPNLSSQWTLGTGWSVSDRLIGSATTGNAIQPIPTLEAGATYEVSFEIISYTSGSVRFAVQRANTQYPTNGSTRSAVGVYTEQFTLSNTQINRFKLDGISAFTGTIGNISLKKVLV